MLNVFTEDHFKFEIFILHEKHFHLHTKCSKAAFPPESFFF